MKCRLFFTFLLLCLVIPHFANAKPRHKTGVSLTFEAGQQIQYNRPDDLGVYTFRTGIPVAAAVDFTFSSASTCGFMMSLAAEYAPYNARFDYKSPKMSVRQEYRFKLAALRIPMYFFLRTRKDKMMFALGGSINFRKVISYSNYLEYNNLYGMEYRSIARYDKWGFPFSFDMRYLYRMTPRSALSLHVSCNLEDYGGLYSLNNAIGPRVDLVRDAEYHFKEMPSFITVSLGCQFTLLPRKRSTMPVVPASAEATNP